MAEQPVSKGKGPSGPPPSAPALKEMKQSNVEHGLSEYVVNGSWEGFLRRKRALRSESSALVVPSLAMPSRPRH